MYSFDYERPTTLAGAVASLKAEGAQALAGGQSLLPTLKQRLAQPAKLVDLKGLPGLSGITSTGGQIIIGAATPHATVAASAEVRTAIPALAALAGGIGDPQVRHRGTIGGSLANNDPSACYPAGVLGLGATIVTDRREIAADDYFKGLFETALGDGEIITSVRFPVPEKAAYVKFEQPASRFALTGVFVAKTSGGVRVAVTGASESGVFRHTGLEQALGGSFDPASVSGVAVAAGGLIADLHGTAAYRANLISVLTERAVSAARG